MAVLTQPFQIDPRFVVDELTSSAALADVIAAMSYALDITEGQPEGHSTKSCLIAMRIAEVIGLSAADHSALFYGTLLKGAICVMRREM